MSGRPTPLDPFKPAREIEAAHAAIVLIAAFLVLRLAAAAFVGLGVDESYSLAIARRLQLSYYDHPPLHQWIIHVLGPVLGYGRGARIPFILLFAGSSWLLFRLTRRLFGGSAGLWAVGALNLSGFFTAVAGGWVLPDGPLIFCLLAAADQLAKILFAEPRREPGAGPMKIHPWLIAGLWVGLAALAKYQAILFAAGAGAFLLGNRRGRAFLTEPGPYLAALVCALAVAPVIVWNAQHDWASFAFQAGRAAPEHALRPLAVLRSLAGQALLLSPWIFAPLVLAALPASRAALGDDRRGFCLALALPGILVFALTPLWGAAGLPHWAMPAWLFLIPLLGERLARAAPWRRWPKVWAAASLGLLIACWATVVSEAATGWVGKTWPQAFPKGDPTIESVEWTPLARTIAGLPAYRPDLFIVSFKWMDAGKIGQALEGAPPIVVLSDDPRGFGYGPDVGDLYGRDALLVMRTRDLTPNLARVRGCFAHLLPLQTVWVGRQGYPEIEFSIVFADDVTAACPELLRPPQL